MDNETFFQNSDEFLAYASVYAAHSDLEMTDDEKEAIISRFGHEGFLKALQIFNDQTEFGSLNIILKASKEYIRNQQEKSAFMHEIKNIFATDGSFSKLEKIQYSFFDKVF